MNYNFTGLGSDTASREQKGEKEAKNPFLTMFNDSMFTMELTETLGQVAEKNEMMMMNRSDLDTSWSLKIEVRTGLSRCFKKVLRNQNI